jgi:hypothetical protein
MLDGSGVGLVICYLMICSLIVPGLLVLGSGLIWADLGQQSKSCEVSQYRRVCHPCHLLQSPILTKPTFQFPNDVTLPGKRQKTCVNLNIFKYPFAEECVITLCKIM